MVKEEAIKRERVEMELSIMLEGSLSSGQQRRPEQVCGRQRGHVVCGQQRGHVGVSGRCPGRVGGERQRQRVCGHQQRRVCGQQPWRVCERQRWRVCGQRAERVSGRVLRRVHGLNKERSDIDS